MMTAVDAGMDTRRSAMLVNIFGPYVMSMKTIPCCGDRKDEKKTRDLDERFEIVDDYIEQA